MADNSPKEHRSISKKEARRIRMQTMSKAEISYLRRKEAAERIFPVFRFVILFGLGFVILYPLIYMISCTFRERGDMNDPTVMWIPRNFTLNVLKETLDAMGFPQTLITTLFLNVGCALVQVISCAVTGYGFARFKFRGRNLLFAVVIMMILVPPQIIALPLYSQFRNFGIGGFSINLIDTMFTMYLPALTGNGIRAGLMILIFRQFFKGLPRELEDAAYIDGCGPFRTFVQVMVPNAAAAFLTVFLFSVVWYWNDYYVCNSFFNTNKTLALMIKNISTVLKGALFNDASLQVSTRELVVWTQAACLISIAPMLIMYVFLQKHFTEGIERSGLVG